MGKAVKTGYEVTAEAVTEGYEYTAEQIEALHKFLGDEGVYELFGWVGAGRWGGMKHLRAYGKVGTNEGAILKGNNRDR